MKGTKLFIFFVLLLFSFNLAAQTKSQLEKEKKENLRRIAEAERILSQTAEEKKVTLGQLQALNQQIRARESLIRSIGSEIKLLDNEISDLSIVVNSLQSDLIQLKDEYSQQIYSSYKANKGNSRLMFLFAAKNFNQLLQRMKYLEQYSDARRLQADQIVLVTEELGQQKSKVEAKRSEQQTLLNQQIKENRKLENSRAKQTSLINALTKKETELKAEVANRKEAIKRLETLIASIVEDEIKKSNTVSTAVAASEAEITRLFETQKNRLNWPVNSGFITSKFGKQQHPVLKRITVINDGVGIQTEKESKVQAVYDGVVSQISTIAGMNNIVLIKHGDYFTVYARLKTINVRKGQRIKAGEVIGEVFTNKDGITELEFQLYKGRTKLDPEKWLAMK